MAAPIEKPQYDEGRGPARPARGRQFEGVDPIEEQSADQSARRAADQPVADLAKGAIVNALDHADAQAEDHPTDSAGKAAVEHHPADHAAGDAADATAQEPRQGAAGEFPPAAVGHAAQHVQPQADRRPDCAPT